MFSTTVLLIWASMSDRPFVAGASCARLRELDPTAREKNATSNQQRRIIWVLPSVRIAGKCVFCRVHRWTLGQERNDASRTFLGSRQGWSQRAHHGAASPAE